MWPNVTILWTPVLAFCSFSVSVIVFLAGPDGPAPFPDLLGVSRCVLSPLPRLTLLTSVLASPSPFRLLFQLTATESPSIPALPLPSSAGPTCSPKWRGSGTVCASRSLLAKSLPWWKSARARQARTLAIM